MPCERGLATGGDDAPETTGFGGARAVVLRCGYGSVETD